MKQLKNTKKIEGSSPERTMKATMTAAAGTIGGTGEINEDNPINMLLFSNMKQTGMKGGLGGFAGMMTSSLGNTMSSNSNYMNVILPLKHILRNCQLTKFDIATEGEQ